MKIKTSDTTFEEFKKADLRIATIVKVEEIEKADKLYKLTLDVGELGEREIVSGIKEWYSPKDLEGKQIVYLANLEPKTFRGVKSFGMLLAVGEEAILIHPKKKVPASSRLH